MTKTPSCPAGRRRVAARRARNKPPAPRPCAGPDSGGRRVGVAATSWNRCRVAATASQVSGVVDPQNVRREGSGSRAQFPSLPVLVERPRAEHLRGADGRQRFGHIRGEGVGRGSRAAAPRRPQRRAANRAPHLARGGRIRVGRLVCGRSPVFVDAAASGRGPPCGSSVRTLNRRGPEPRRAGPPAGNRSRLAAPHGPRRAVAAMAAAARSGAMGRA